MLVSEMPEACPFRKGVDIKDVYRAKTGHDSRQSSWPAIVRRMRLETDSWAFDKDTGEQVPLSSQSNAKVIYIDQAAVLKKWPTWTNGPKDASGADTIVVPETEGADASPRRGRVHAKKTHYYPRHRSPDGECEACGASGEDTDILVSVYHYGQFCEECLQAGECETDPGFDSKWECLHY
eukprot:TRINITY_DN6861_c0_g1_i2.p3 TRINITY_DN6861_c0_g1~~TRINITY_DN6861_c0_g1_i2.p3  ORF type:complete len:180 (-),score=24.35 TRINITY_DN6861_c0_g1_i2:136-675(-)